MAAHPFVRNPAGVVVTYFGSHWCETWAYRPLIIAAAFWAMASTAALVGALEMTGITDASAIPSPNSVMASLLPGILTGLSSLP